MLRVMDLLRIPSLEEAYIAAGGKGIYRDIRKLEVLEEPYPSVVRFLTANEFYLTNFWSLAADKEGRINLIRAMIEHHCAGIGVMPGVHLNDVIDEEILDLANEHDFPVIAIPTSARWGDIITEYGILANGANSSYVDGHLTDVLEIFNHYHIYNDVNSLCVKLSALLEMPLIISTNTIYSCRTEDINVAVVLSRVRNILRGDENKIQSPIMVRVDNERSAIVYRSKSCIIIGCVSNISLHEKGLQLYHQIAPYVLLELTRLSWRGEEETGSLNLIKYSNTRFYVALIKGKDYASYEGQLEKKYLIYERNNYERYLLVIFPENKEEGQSIYQEYQNLYSSVNPELMIFSQTCYDQAHLTSEVAQMKQLAGALSFLEGIYCMDELPLIYILENAPQEYDRRLFSSSEKYIKISHEAQSFLTTMRLYLILHNLTDVSKLLGIHVNSVKYRLTRALDYLGYDEDTALSELPYLRCLLDLEHLAAQNK